MGNIVQGGAVCFAKGSKQHQETQNEAWSEIGRGRRTATAEMRARAVRLEREAANWRCLADALDAISLYACKDGGDEENGPHIGVGSQAEQFLWALASGSAS